MYCTNCGAEIPNSPYCQFCGTKVVSHTQSDEMHASMLSQLKERITSDPMLRNNRIKAIKYYREETGCGLADAKTAIEEILGSYE